MSSKMIGVDVGGTFTDIFVLDEQKGTAEVAKVSPEDHLRADL